MLTGNTIGRMNESQLKRALIAACAAGLLMVIAACETTEGAGRDLEKLGDNIEDAARDAK